ncbi:MAG: hypothetical protein JW943_01325 [Deltaproteobacteria bacterium]|nr:hypothetical protein [Deltaproteobacteria bacterium]
MNKRLLTITIIPAIAITLFIFVKFVAAGGVIDHTVNIINDTDCPAHIVFQTFNGDTQEHTVNSHMQYKFHAGKKCPASLYGSVTESNGKQKAILIHCIKDGKNTTDPQICAQLFKGDLNCKSSTHRLRPFDNYQTGRGYHFIKE